MDVSGTDLHMPDVERGHLEAPELPDPRRYLADALRLRPSNESKDKTSDDDGDNFTGRLPPQVQPHVGIHVAGALPKVRSSVT